ncbi:MAG: NAD(P)H-binding protein [bacterium]
MPPTLVAVIDSAIHRRQVFVTGATGYIGRELARSLVSRGHVVRALVREGAERRLPRRVSHVVGDATDSRSYALHVAPADTLVQLVGTPHPGPGKDAGSRSVDLPSGLAAVEASVIAGVRHLVYVSVAQPAPVMHGYIAVRAAVEARIREANAQFGLRATILRPWYVLGPGHYWPYLLLPLYAIGRALPATREGARRLGLVTHAQMVAALVEAVESPPTDAEPGVRVWDVPRIRLSATSRSPRHTPAAARRSSR